jgi:hypothetical protein
MGGYTKHLQVHGFRQGWGGGLRHLHLLDFLKNENLEMKENVPNINNKYYTHF